MRNNEIRQSAKAAGVKLWQIAEVVGVNDGNFSRKLRHELPEDEKQKILEIVEDMEQQQKRIAMIDAQARMMQQRAQQFLMEDPDGQAQQIADARMSLMQDAQAEEIPGEEEYEEQEAELDEEVPVEEE